MAIIRSKQKQDSLRQQIYKTVITNIIAGQYAIDTVLTESNLIKESGCSKSPVRDALIELCKDGILVNLPRYGYRITHYTDRWFEQVKEFRLCTEIHYLNKHWYRVDEQLINKLESALDYDSSSDHPFVADAIEHWMRNRHFHLSLAEHWCDPFFYDILQTALNQQIIAYAQFYWSSGKLSSFPLQASAHISFIEQLRKRDLEMAKQVLAQDIATFATTNGV